MTERILITGSTGFIGRSMLTSIKQNGFIVDTLNRSSTVDDLDRGMDNFLWSDLSRLDLSKYIAVVHLAGKAHDTRHLSDYEEYEQINYQLAKRMFDAWYGSTCQSFIFMSTILAVNEDVNVELTEAAQGLPDSYYGVSKRKAEDYIMENSPLDRNVYLLRPALVYGKRLKGNLAKLLTAVEHGIPLPLGAIGEKRSYLYVQNLNQIILRLIAVCPSSGIYHLADDEQISLNHLIKLLSELTSSRAFNIPLPRIVLKGLAVMGDLFNLPYNREVHTKLTSELRISNVKIKAALNLEKMPFTLYDGLKSIVNK